MKKLAIIDDEQMLAEVLKELIERMGGFEVEIFTKADDFFIRNESYSFDIVFSDLNMPGMNGIQCFKKLSLMERKPEKMVIMTGESDFAKEEYKLDYCLIKPFTRESIRSCLF